MSEYVTLTDVQVEVNRQMARDYGRVPQERVNSLTMLGLAEESGEVVGLMKRVLRGNPNDKIRATREAFVEELGDVLWYLAACCNCAGTTLDEIWEQNKIKLEKRYGK